MAKVECPYNFLDGPQALPTQQAPCQVIALGTLLPLLSTLLVCECPLMCSCAQKSNLAAMLDFCPLLYHSHQKQSTDQFYLTTEPVQFCP